MGTYNIPRNVKGEGRILFIFSTKSLMYSAIGLGVGLPFYFIFRALKLTIVGILIVALFALIGFIIGTFKIPEMGALKATKTIGGEKIDDIIKRAITFKKKGNRIYLYTKEEKKYGQYHITYNYFKHSTWNNDNIINCFRNSIYII